MEHLFHQTDDKNGSFNDAGGEFDKELRDAVDPIMLKWVEKGYSRPEMESVAFSALWMSIMYNGLTHRFSKKEAEDAGE